MDYMAEVRSLEVDIRLLQQQYLQHTRLLVELLVIVLMTFVLVLQVHVELALHLFKKKCENQGSYLSRRLFLAE